MSTIDPGGLGGPPPPVTPAAPRRGWWGRLSRGGKIGVVVAAILVVGGIGALFGAGEEEQEERESGTSTTRAAAGATTSSRAPVTTSASKRASNLKVGDCFQEPQSLFGGSTTTAASPSPGADDNSQTVFSVATVNCGEAHDHEVTGIHELSGPDNAYPGAEAIATAADAPCQGFFTGYVGAGQDQSTLESVPLLFPTKGSWESGFRDVVCVASADDRSPVTGSARGQGPTS